MSEYRKTVGNAFANALLNDRTLFNYVGYSIKETFLETNIVKIFKHDSLVAYAVHDEYVDDSVIFVMPTNGRLISLSTQKNICLDLNRQGIKVVFVPVMNLGFGLPEPKFLPVKTHRTILKRIAKYSDSSEQNSVMAGTGERLFGAELTCGTVYSYRQRVNGTMINGEDVIMTLVNIMAYIQPDKDLIYNDNLQLLEYWLCLYEPNMKQVKTIVSSHVRSIMFLYERPDVVKDYHHLEYLDKIFNKTIMNCEDMSIRYEKHKVYEM